MTLPDKGYNIMKIIISQENSSPIEISLENFDPINDRPEKSSEGLITVLGTITAAWLGLAILGIIVSLVEDGIETGICKSKIKKTLKLLTPDEKNQLIEIMKDDMTDLIKFIDTDTKKINDKLKSLLSIDKYKKYIKNSSIDDHEIVDKLESLSNLSLKDKTFNNKLVSIVEAKRRSDKKKSVYGGFVFDVYINCDTTDYCKNLDYENPDWYNVYDVIEEINEKISKVGKSGNVLPNNIFGQISRDIWGSDPEETGVIKISIEYDTTIKPEVIKKKFKFFFDKMDSLEK